LCAYGIVCLMTGAKRSAATVFGDL